MAPDGSEKASFNLTEGLSPHEWEDVKVDLVATDPVLAEAVVGCWYQVMADEGTGSGHEMNVERLVLWLAGENHPVCIGWSLAMITESRAYTCRVLTTKSGYTWLEQGSYSKCTGEAARLSGLVDCRSARRSS